MRHHTTGKATGRCLRLQIGCQHLAIYQHLPHNHNQRKVTPSIPKASTMVPNGKSVVLHLLRNSSCRVGFPLSSARLKLLTSRLPQSRATLPTLSSRNYKPIHTRAMKLTEEEKRQMSEGFRDPDIVKEAKACLFVLIVFVCAMLVCGGVFGVFYLLNRLVEWLL